MGSAPPRRKKHPPVCTVDGCEKPTRQSGYCAMHDRRVRLYGGPGPAGPIGSKASLEDRMTNHTQVHGPIPAHAPQLGNCHVWTGHVNKYGYGTVGHNYKVLKVHRVAYAMAYGRIPRGLQIDHRCRNKRCVRPEHLRLATNRLNQQNQGGARRDNRGTGVRGVFPNGNGFKVQICHKSRTHYFGTFPTLEEAKQVAAIKYRELHTYIDPNYDDPALL